jgi:hypothetical protein
MSHEWLSQLLFISHKGLVIRRMIISAFVLFMPGLVIADGLFDTDAPLAIALESDFYTMTKERDKTIDYPGRLTINKVSLPVELSLRGVSRLKSSNCRNPPLRVDFKKSELKSTTPFAGEGDMKLVVQCGSGSTYADYLRIEFLVYKLLNKITPLSYRVRWVEIAYSESGKSGSDIRPGFFVEVKKNLAKRNDLKTANKVLSTSHSELNSDQAALIEHFQFLIGNTDYSLVSSADPDECCHNAKLLRVQDDDAPRPYLPIIYDFDSTGLVNASYTAPATSLGIKYVTQRLFRGGCRDQEVMDNARNSLMQLQPDLIELIMTDPLLRSGKKKSVARYLTKGFGIFASEKNYQRFIVKKCL